MTDAELIERLRKRGARLLRLADMLESFQSAERAEEFLSNARTQAANNGKAGNWIPTSVDELVADIRHAAELQLGMGPDEAGEP